MRKKIYCIVNSKGGVGKTAVTQHLAAGLARKGKKVLVVDLDSNRSLTSCMYDGQVDKSIADVFLTAINELDPVDPDEIIHHSTVENVDIIPSEAALTGVDNRLPGVIGSDFIIRELIEQVKDRYDYIILDCPGNMNKRTINAMVAAESVIIPVIPTYKSDDQIPEIIKVINQVRRYNPGLILDGVLLNMVDKRPISTRAEIARLRSEYNVFVTEIPHSCRDGEASKAKESIFDYDKNGKLAAAYESLVNEVDQEEVVEESNVKAIGGNDGGIKK